MEVVDTNRSKASFKRLNKQTLEGSKRSESEAEAEEREETAVEDCGRDKKYNSIKKIKRAE